MSTNLDEETPYYSEFLIGKLKILDSKWYINFKCTSSTPDRLYYKSSKEKSILGIIDILDFETNKILPFPDQENFIKIGSNLSLFASFSQFNTISVLKQATEEASKMFQESLFIRMRLTWVVTPMITLNLFAGREAMRLQTQSHRTQHFRFQNQLKLRPFLPYFTP